MRFGTVVLVERGGGAPTGQPGCRRTVRGVLVGARGKRRQVRLLDDDPLDMSGWAHAGDLGWWSESAVKGGGSVSHGRAHSTARGALVAAAKRGPT